MGKKVLVFSYSSFSVPYKMNSLTLACMTKMTVLTSM